MSTITPAQLQDMQARVARGSKRAIPTPQDSISGTLTPKPCQDSREASIHAKIEAELVRRRWYYVRSRFDRATTQQPGVPDFICAAPYGKTYWIEVKKPGGKLTKEQNITRHVLMALNHNYFTVYSFAEFLDVIL